jgi:prephenate dehydratase
MAAEVYHLEILKFGIETNQQNYTRFLVISKRDTLLKNGDLELKANKTSICFEVAHRPGTLSEILDIFSRHEVNMTKIQSVPILGRPYQYSFHVDLEWIHPQQFRQAMAIISSKVSRLVSFGEYLCGERTAIV